MHTKTGGGRAAHALAPRGVEGETTRGDVFRALHEIGVAIGGVLDPPELAHLVADRARELLHAGGAGLYVTDDSGQFLTPLHSSDAEPTALEPSIPLGEGAAGQAFLRGEPVEVTDYAAWPHGGTWARAHGVAAALAVPLQVAEHRIGALSVRTYTPRTWSEEDVQTLTLLAAQVAPVLEAARFHQQAERRTRELEALYGAEASLHRSLRTEGVFEALVDVATDVLHSDKTTVLIWDDRHEALIVGAARGFSPAALARMRHGPGEGITWLVATQGQPIAVQDAAADPRVVHAVTDLEGICSLLHVPIVRSGEVLGVFAINYCHPHVFAGNEERVLLALAQRAALALDNAELFERERLSRERLEVALEAGRMGTWDWNARSNTVTWSPQLEAIHGLLPGTFAGTFDAYLSDVHPEDLERVRATIADSLWSGEHHLEYRIVWPDHSVHWVEARGRLLRDGSGEPMGLCGVCLDVTDRKLAEQERTRLMQSERAALRAKTALEERQKLARELHDSVSQALYGIALGTQTALDVLARDPDVTAADDALGYVLELAESGLAEMRSLIFELRPESLQAEGLIAAIERNAAAARSRHNLQVAIQLCPEPDLTLAAKEAVYRIAQEALHNTVRHARAKTVSIRLDPDDGGVVLEVVDDGVGFDPDQPYPGHLGLVSMRERVAELGGELIIRSRPGDGTRVYMRIPTGVDAAQ